MVNDTREEQNHASAGVTPASPDASAPETSAAARPEPGAEATLDQSERLESIKCSKTALTLADLADRAKRHQVQSELDELRERVRTLESDVLRAQHMRSALFRHLDEERAEAKRLRARIVVLERTCTAAFQLEAFRECCGKTIAVDLYCANCRQQMRFGAWEQPDTGGEDDEPKPADERLRDAVRRIDEAARTMRQHADPGADSQHGIIRWRDWGYLRAMINAALADTGGKGGGK